MLRLNGYLKLNVMKKMLKKMVYQVSIVNSKYSYFALGLLLFTLSGCTLNPCFDEAILYGTPEKETICYLEKKVKHGPHTKWYPKAKATKEDPEPEAVKAFSRTYRNDALDGSYLEWYSNGQLKTEASYVNGKLSGMIKKYYSNGQLRLSARYNKNIKDGPYKEFFKNGKPKLEANFNPIGQREGKQTRYRMNGRPISEYTYYQGKLVGKRFWRYDGSLEPVLTHR